MTVAEFEKAVWNLEGIRIVVRASEGTIVGDYKHKNRGAKMDTVSEWRDRRVASCLGDLEFVIVDGNGEHAHGNMKLQTLRETYLSALAA